MAYRQKTRLNDDSTQTASTPLDQPSIVLVTGLSGAGRSTATNALEDLGFETIENLPLGLMPRLMEGPPLEHRIALGISAEHVVFQQMLCWISSKAR